MDAKQPEGQANIHPPTPSTTLKKRKKTLNSASQGVKQRAKVIEKVVEDTQATQATQPLSHRRPSPA